MMRRLGPFTGLDASGHSFLFAGVFGPLAAGSHSYTIQLSDSKGNVANYSGTFKVSASTLAISDVVVAEASSAKNGKLEANEPLVITWAVTGGHTVAAASLVIDGGKAIKPIYGPYASRRSSASNWAGVVGPLTARRPLLRHSSDGPLRRYGELQRQLQRIACIDCLRCGRGRSPFAQEWHPGIKRATGHYLVGHGPRFQGKHRRGDSGPRRWHAGFHEVWAL